MFLDARPIHEANLADGHVVSDDRARIDMAFVHRCLAQTYWAAGRSAALTERSWDHSLCFGVHAPERGRLVGFGRVLTDYALRAHIGDVFIHPGSRGRGLGHALIETMLGHPELTTVTHWTLTTSDAHSLYERYGFRVARADPRWMTLDQTRAA